VRELTLMAMSLTDRPRPTLMLLRSTLRRHLFAFVWLPRDELTTRRRLAIGTMMEEARTGGSSTGRWSSATGSLR
jgi:glutamate dehydrogenase